MSSPSDGFECRWQASRLLLKIYLAAQALALLALLGLDIAPAGAAIGVTLCLAHAAWVVPRAILLGHRAAFSGIKHDSAGWHIWSERGGWQSIRVAGDSVVLPLIVVLRFQLQHDGRVDKRIKSACIPCDALPPELHRRLRVRLKFSRRGSAAPE